jgi:hypothetical protein
LLTSVAINCTRSSSPSSASKIASVNGSSPVAHAADQMRGVRPASIAGTTNCVITTCNASSSRKKYVSCTTSASDSA